jgi:hypothetical protein
MNRKPFIALVLAVLVICYYTGLASGPYRVGTTTAAFLELGVGGAGLAMGDAYVAMANDMSAIYWNPAGLAMMEKNQAMFMYQPWVVDVNTLFAGFGLVFPQIGTVGLGLFAIDYGNIDVTTLEYQDGTGEQYTAYDLSISLSYARKLVEWFSFGVNGKYVHSKIWHSSASAMVVDLGVIVNTGFFSPTGRQIDGMKIGMSVANYGGKMRYDGMDILFPVDIDPSAEGNYQNLQGEYRMQDWELPLLFRVGLMFNPLVLSNQRLQLEVDALHPNNTSEYVNLGAQYVFTIPAFGDLYIRGGYKGLFLIDSQYGLSAGGGIKTWITPNYAMNIDYAFRTIGVLGDVHCTSLSFTF